jgi:hypothetical protein
MSLRTDVGSWLISTRRGAASRSGMATPGERRERPVALGGGIAGARIARIARIASDRLRLTKPPGAV